MGNVTVNVYSDDECTEGDTISLLKTLINLVTDNFNNINLKLKEMAITLDDVQTQVDDLKTQVASVKDVNTKAYQDLEAINVDLKAQLDAATQGGTIVDTVKLQAISDKISEVKTDLANSIIVTTVPPIDTTGDTTTTDTTTTTTTPPPTDPNNPPAW